jgi:hypothetical protein
MLNKQIQSEVKEINKKLMKIEKNTTSTTTSKPQSRNVNSKTITNKKTDNKKKKGK